MTEPPQGQEPTRLEYFTPEQLARPRGPTLLVRVIAFSFGVLFALVAAAFLFNAREQVELLPAAIIAALGAAFLLWPSGKGKGGKK